MMNFRQRLGWVSVAFFLVLSVAVAYYVFEVRSLGLEQVQSGVSGPSVPPPPSWTRALGARMPALPVWLWASAFLLPYLQLFLFLFSCTRADPRAIGYCVLPVCLVLLCSRCTARKPANHRAPSLIHT